MRSNLPEIDAARKNTGKEPADFVVGYDALGIYVHKDNPLDEITLAQIAEIYEEGGTLTKWSELGVTLPSGQDEIIRVSRQSSSGTYEFLREHVLQNRDFKLGSRDLNGSKEVVELVANTPGAIGYSGMGYATAEVKMLRVAPEAGAPGVPPSVEATLDKSYPIARSLHLYTRGRAPGRGEGLHRLDSRAEEARDRAGDRLRPCRRCRRAESRTERPDPASPDAAAHRPTPGPPRRPPAAAALGGPWWARPRSRRSSA